jgi:putative alpha-1,2-mannosidase
VHPFHALILGSIWDQFRSQLPLLTITDPVAVTDMVRSLIDTYRHLGWLPDCRMSLNKGYTQVIRARTPASCAAC